MELLWRKGGGPDHDDRRAYHKEEFWLQPKYGYAVVKHVFSDCPAVEEDPRRKEKQIIHEYDGFRQTPRGVWYPTVSRWKHASSPRTRANRAASSSATRSRTSISISRRNCPTNCSHGVARRFAGGIHFAPRDEKPRRTTSADPAAGRSAAVSGSAADYRARRMDAASRRLEAAPAEDLDKWIAELERIIGKKLDGWLQTRQVCRTDFVSHMSVAFDGLKWNAKSADNLFQRAQTMPTSEAKVWKEAFERLLKKEIEPADKVPLVLIPVDALYEGQKYSADRAKKYLARLKQLTADDVSLWKDKVDECGGTRLDAAMNIILLDDFFDKEKFQRDKFKAAIGARKK